MKYIVCAYLIVVAVVVCSGAPQGHNLKPKLRTLEEIKHQLAEHPAPKVPVVEKEVVVVEKEVKKVKEDEEAILFKKQAENAHYSFESQIDDGIMDHSHYRSEKRDGLAVEGSYSYSDGFFRRTVHYLADDKGYRVVKEEQEPIGDGPVVDPNGHAVVKSSLGAEYTITLDDYQKRVNEN